MIIMSGPAGSGKGTVRKCLMEKSDNFSFSVSATTRAPRAEDTEGVTYYFVSREDFEKKIASGEMLEYAEYVGNFYGTPKTPVEKALDEGRDVILEIETKGAMAVKEKMPDAVTVMILPPDGKTLRARLEGRGTETPDVVEKRMNTARDEVLKLDLYDYVVINDNGMSDKAADDIMAIITAEKAKTKRNIGIKDTYFN